MRAQQGHVSLKLKPRWRIRRLGLSMALSLLIVSALLWAPLLMPRTFIASGQWVANGDPLLNQIDWPPLHQLTSDILKLSETDRPADLQFTLRSTPDPTLLISTTAPTAQQAIGRVNRWLTQRVSKLTEQLQHQLDLSKKQHQSNIHQNQIQLQTQGHQLATARAQISKTALPTHQVLSEKISQTLKQLQQLTRQQAVFRGANNTLQKLFARRKLLEQDLNTHQKQYGSNQQNPAVKLAQDQLEKINLRIDIISKASKLDGLPEAKLAALAQQISQAQQALTRYQKQQKQLARQTQAQTLINQLAPQYQALSNQLIYHQQQVNLIDKALAGQLTWGTIQPALRSKTPVIWPTLGYIVLLAGLGGLGVWLLIQWLFRMTDRTLDQNMPLEASLGLTVLGHITLLNHRSPALSWLRRLTIYPLLGGTVIMILCLSLKATYHHLHPPPGSLSHPGNLSQVPSAPGSLSHPGSLSQVPSTPGSLSHPGSLSQVPSAPGSLSHPGSLSSFGNWAIQSPTSGGLGKTLEIQHSPRPPEPLPMVIRIKQPLAQQLADKAS